MEIERKYLVRQIPDQLSSYPCHHIEQAYLSTDPVLRIRQLDDRYILTYKSKGLLARQEVELPLTKESYLHLKTKADGTIITKNRYVISLEKETAELDLFLDSLAGFIMVEVEFSSVEEADSFTPPSWFGEEVTYDSAYHNSTLSALDESGRISFLNHLQEKGYFYLELK